MDAIEHPAFDHRTASFSNNIWSCGQAIESGFDIRSLRMRIANSERSKMAKKDAMKAWAHDVEHLHALHGNNAFPCGSELETGWRSSGYF